MNCQNCGATLPEGAVFCGECGSPVQAKPKQQPNPEPQNNKINCLRCGTQNNKYDRFCSNCGNPLYQRTQPRPTPPRNTALIVLTIIVAVLLIAILGIFVYEYVIGGSSGFVNEPEQVTPESVIETQLPVATPEQVTPEPIITTQPPAPVFHNISASSTRGTDYTSGHAVNYYPEYAVDGIYETAWSSNREIELTPSITLSSGTAQYVTGVRVANGYFKTEEIYRNNRRVTKFRIEYEGGQIIHHCGIDNYRIMQDIRFDTPVTTNYIKVQVLESYEGKWKDIAISEIEVY